MSLSSGCQLPTDTFAVPLDMVHGPPSSTLTASTRDVDMSSVHSASLPTYHQQLLPLLSDSHGHQPLAALAEGSIIGPADSGTSAPVSLFPVCKVFETQRSWSSAGIYTRGEIMWYCCQCGNYNGLEEVTLACMECQHPKCGGCTREEGK